MAAKAHPGVPGYGRGTRAELQKCIAHGKVTVCSCLAMHSSLPWFSTFAGEWRTFSGRSRRGPTATLGVVQMREARVETAIGTRPRADGAASRRPLETRLNVLATNRSVVLHAAKDTRASHEHPTCTGTFYTNDEHAPVAAGHWIPARGSLNCQRTLVPFGQPAIHAPPLFPFWRGGQLCGAFLLPPAPPKVPWARRAGRLGSRRWRRPRQAGWAGLGWRWPLAARCLAQGVPPAGPCNCGSRSPATGAPVHWPARWAPTSPAVLPQPNQPAPATGASISPNPLKNGLTPGVGHGCAALARLAAAGRKLEVAGRASSAAVAWPCMPSHSFIQLFNSPTLGRPVNQSTGSKMVGWWTLLDVPPRSLPPSAESDAMQVRGTLTLCAEARRS